PAAADPGTSWVFPVPGLGIVGSPDGHGIASPFGTAGDGNTSARGNRPSHDGARMDDHAREPCRAGPLSALECAASHRLGPLAPPPGAFHDSRLATHQPAHVPGNKPVVGLRVVDDAGSPVGGGDLGPTGLDTTR